MQDKQKQEKGVPSGSTTENQRNAKAKPSTKILKVDFTEQATGGGLS
jgi:hypothetical protein